eukprot:5837194-Prymnesium_polylepis.1
MHARDHVRTLRPRDRTLEPRQVGVRVVRLRHRLAHAKAIASNLPDDHLSVLRILEVDREAVSRHRRRTSAAAARGRRAAARQASQQPVGSAQADACLTKLEYNNRGAMRGAARPLPAPKR